MTLLWVVLSLCLAVDLASSSAVTSTAASLICSVPAPIPGSTSEFDSEADIVLVQTAIDMADRDDGNNWVLSALVDSMERFIDIKYEIAKEYKRENTRCKRLVRGSRRRSSSSDKVTVDRLPGEKDLKSTECTLHLGWLNDLNTTVAGKISRHQTLIDQRLASPCSNEYPAIPTPRIIPWKDVGHWQAVHGHHLSSSDAQFWQELQDLESQMAPRTNWSLPRIPGVKWVTSSSDSKGSSDSINWRDSRGKPIKYIRKNWGALLFKY